MKTESRNKCRYFNGIMNDVCKAGIHYKTLTNNRPLVYLPCMATQNESDEATCVVIDRYTNEEMREIRNQQRQSANLNVALAVQIQQLSGNSGTTECPKCKGVVKWNRAQSNGHIHAACQTQGCLAFMQ